jgi:hypothetical protein
VVVKAEPLPADTNLTEELDNQNQMISKLKEKCAKLLNGKIYLKSFILQIKLKKFRVLKELRNVKAELESSKKEVDLKKETRAEESELVKSLQERNAVLEKESESLKNFISDLEEKCMRRQKGSNKCDQTNLENY